MLSENLVVLSCLIEFHPWLMVEDKDLVSQQLQGVKTNASSIFIVIGEAFFF